MGGLPQLDDGSFHPNHGPGVNGGSSRQFFTYNPVGPGTASLAFQYRPAARARRRAPRRRATGTRRSRDGHAPRASLGHRTGAKRQMARTKRNAQGAQRVNRRRIVHCTVCKPPPPSPSPGGEGALPPHLAASPACRGAAAPSRVARSGRRGAARRHSEGGELGGRRSWGAAVYVRR